MFDFLIKTQNQITAFEYLRFYSEKGNLDCSITLEFTIRFILAYFFREIDNAEESQIINDEGIGNYRKALEKLVSRLPVTVILLEDAHEEVFNNSLMNKQAIIFLLKKDSEFFIVYPEEFYLLFKTIPENQNYLESYPFIWSTLLTSQKETNMSIPLDEFDESNDCLMDERYSIRIPPECIQLHTKFNFPDSEDLIISDLRENCISRNMLNLDESCPTLTSSSIGVSNKSKISNQKCQKVMKLIEKTFDSLKLFEDFTYFCECKRLKNEIEINEISEFLEIYMKLNWYPKESFKNFALSLYVPLDVSPMNEASISNIMVSSGIDTSLPQICKEKIIALITKSITIMIKSQKNINNLIKEFP
jgi:hypothetical protein